MLHELFAVSIPSLLRPSFQTFDGRAVMANNEVLQVPDDGMYSLNKTLGEDQTAVHLDWQMFRDKLGNSILISTGEHLELAP